MDVTLTTTKCDLNQRLNSERLKRFQNESTKKGNSMREEIQAEMYIPHWDLIYLNTSNNAKQRRPSATTRTEHDSDLRMSSKPHTNFPRHINLHYSRMGKTDKMEETIDEFSELDYALMRENIEKRKRIRILKQVKSVFNEMFTRVQDITDGLKIQLDEAMNEHRKANKMFGKLQSHLTGVQNGLQFDDDDENFVFKRNDMEIECLQDRLTPGRLILPKIESANSSRPCSLPQVFKVDSSTISPACEWFSSSKTNNIRKIAVKKSQEKSFMDARDRNRKNGVIEEENVTFHPRNSKLKTNSASVNSSKEPTKGKPRRKQKMLEVIESIVTSESRLKSSDMKYQTNKTVKPTDKSSTEAMKDRSGGKLVQSELSTSTTSSKESVTQSSVIYPQTFEITKTQSKDEKISAIVGQGQKSSCTTSGYGSDILKGKDQTFKSEKYVGAKYRALPKLKTEQIVEKIKSIEDCIIQPNKLRKEFADEELKQQHHDTNKNKQRSKKK